MKIVIENLLDAHLTIRIQENEWGKDFKMENAPETGSIHVKLEADKKAAQAIPNADIKATTSHEWLTYFYKLAEFEASEQAIKDDTRSLPFHLHLGMFVAKSESMLQRSMHAARSYIAAEMITHCKSKFEDEKRFHLNEKTRLQQELDSAAKIPNAKKEHIQKLKTELEDHTRKYDLLIGAEADKYHETFFNDVIKTRDKRSKKDGSPLKNKDDEALKEDTFSDFVYNSKYGLRKPDNLYKLIAGPAVVATVAPIATTTAHAQPARATATTVSTVGIYANSTAAKNDEAAKTAEKESYSYATRSRV
jgi:hypothetical protein